MTRFGPLVLALFVSWASAAFGADYDIWRVQRPELPTWPARTNVALVLYVSPHGNDAWSGRTWQLRAPDGPFATLERARDEIRQLKRQGKLPRGGILVQLLPGTYQLEQALELGQEDSGSEESPIIYAAKPGALVRITGARLVQKLSPVTDPKVLAQLPPEARSRVVVADLKAIGITDYGTPAGQGLAVYFNDEPLTLARWPNEGFVNIAAVTDEQPFDVRGRKGSRVGKFFYEGDRPNRWLKEPEVWLHGYWFWDWSDGRQQVARIDPDKRLIELKPPHHHYGYRTGQYYYAYNLLCELDQPGEWYLDRQHGLLYLWPPDDIEKATVTVSVAQSLLSLKDVSYVCFRGLVLEGTRSTIVNIRNGNNVAIVGCVLRNSGYGAISATGGSGCFVAGCELYNLGGHGVRLSGGDQPTLTAAGHIAYNNHIHHYALWYRMYRPAVGIGGVGNFVLNNHIHDAPHQAIGFSGNDHLIEGNHIHDVCTESNDAGAIYAGRNWTMRGTVIRGNFLHDITGFRNKGCVGVYLDDMYCGTAIVGNVFYRVTRAAFIGGGRDNLVENNLFVDCKPALHVDARALGWASYAVPTTMMERLKAVPYQNELWRSRYPRLAGILEDEPAAPKGNVIRCNVCVYGRWDEIYKPARPYIRLENNLVLTEDPGFVDPENLDFRLSRDSSVFKQLPCFKPIEMDKIGLVNDWTRRALPAVK